MLKHVPAKQLSMKPIEELSKRIRQYSREEMQGFVLRFATDFLRLAPGFARRGAFDDVHGTVQPDHRRAGARAFADEQQAL